MASSYKIGAAVETIATLDTLSLRDPQPAPAFYAEYVELGNGMTLGVGWLEAEWHWDFISTTDIAALRIYCTGVSDDVYITTPNNDGSFTTYAAVMIWPQAPEVRHGDYFTDFGIRFVQLVEVPGTT